MEAKINEQNDDFWLTAEVKGAVVKIIIFIFSEEKVQMKLSGEISLLKNLKELGVIERPQ